MGNDRRPWLLLLAALTFVSSGCANQTPVIPMLHVEPNAGARIFYLQRRAEAMFGKDAGSSSERERERESAHDEDPEEEREEGKEVACAPRTWGAAPAAPDPQGSSCDSQ